MAGYIGSKSSVTQVDGYTEAEADAEFVNDPNGAITVDGSNNVGIGTSSPSTQLEVKGSTYSLIRVNGGNTNNAGIDFGDTDDVDIGRIRYDNSSDAMQFWTNNAERMRINSSGNVGIGTNSPDAQGGNQSTIINLEGADDIVYFSGGSGGNAVDDGLAIEGVATGVSSGDKRVGSILMTRGNTSTTSLDSKMTFYTTGSGSHTERMRIDSSGRVGIGTSSPASAYKVTIDGDESMIRMNHTGTGSNGTLDLAVNSTIATISANYSTTAIPLRFLTGAQERMRIHSNGNTSFGTTNNLAVVGVGTTVGNWGIIVKDYANNSALVQFESTVGTVGSITHSGSSTAYNTSSDYRLKENVVDLTGASARVNQLNPSRFNWIADDTNTLVDGFLAHEVATVVPEAITGTHNGMMDEEYEVTPAVLDDDGNVTTEAVMGTRSVPDYQGIDQSKLVPLLTAALQEALTEIASLKTRVEALEA